MRPLRWQFKLSVILLAGSGMLACTCAAYDVDVGHIWGTLLVAVGLTSQGRTAKEAIVAAGYELSLDGRRVSIRQVPPDVLAQRLAWAGIHLKDGWLSFEGQTLESVVAEFNRHNARQLSIGDRATGQLRVGGKFHVADLDGFIAALAITHGVKAVASPPQGPAPAVIVLQAQRPDGSGSAYPERPIEPLQ